VIYVDSCLLIYAVEDQGSLGDRARELLSSAPRPRFAISPMVILETLVWPMRTRNTTLRNDYEELFGEFAMIELDLHHYLHAADLRAESPGLKTVDALHLAAAELAGCEELWTNDRRLAAASAGLAVDVIGTS
jgi:predicted nucleic acid-binding protein